jgi:nucleoside-diphosphate-sugar epimerase
MRSALVTGANGFIGSHMADELIEAGWSVRCLLRPKSDARWLDEERADVRRCDVTNPEELRDSLSGIDVVFHVAGVTKALKDEDYFKGNVGYTRDLVEASLAAGKVKRFVLVSSLAAAGPTRNERPLSEADEERPVSVYGRSKLEGERALLEFKDRLNITIVRPPGVYGPRDSEFFIYFKMIQRGFAPVPLGGTSCLDLIHVVDLVRGIRLAAESERAVGRTYFLRGPGPHRIRDLAEIIAKALGKTPLYIHVPQIVARIAAALTDMHSRLTRGPNIFSTDKLGEMLFTWTCNEARAREDLGFRPGYSLEEGIQETARWYRENGWLPS